MNRKKLLMLILCFTMSVLLSGCFMKSVSELYKLPQQTEQYRAVQLAIEETAPRGSQLMSPIEGNHLQPIQMADFDGDSDDEIIGFVMASGEKPLKVYVFDFVDGKYVNTGAAECGGRQFLRVDYAQIDGKGGDEIILSRAVAGQSTKMVDIYTFSEGNLLLYLSTAYTDYLLTDLDSDGKQDLFLTNFTGGQETGTAELYRYIDNRISQEPYFPLTVTVSGLRRIHTGNLMQGQKAIFVDGVLSDGTAISEAFTFTGQDFSMLSSLHHLQLASMPAQGEYVFATDFDMDGIMEFPQVMALANDLETPAGAYQCIRWYEVQAGGQKKADGVTYHHFSGGWYLRIPNRLGMNFSMGQTDAATGNKGLTFYVGSQQEKEYELFTMFAFTGAGRNIAVSEHNCFVLSSRNDTVYAARLGDGARGLNLTQEELSAMFHFIRVNWNMGET